MNKQQQQRDQFMKDVNEALETIKTKYQGTTGIGLIAIATSETHDETMIDACMAVLGRHDMLVLAAIDLLTKEECMEIFRDAASLTVEEMARNQKNKPSTNRFDLN